MSVQPLFTPYRMDDLDLPNRIVTAPRTRMRAGPDDHVPSSLQAAYDVQRATAGLIVTEGVAVNPTAFFDSFCRIVTAPGRPGKKYSDARSIREGE